MKNQSPSFRQHMVAHIKKVTVHPSPLILHCLQNLIKQIFIAIDKIKKKRKTLLMTMDVIVVFVAFPEI